MNRDINNEIIVAPISTKPAAMKPDQSKVAEKIDTAIEFFLDASITALVKRTLMYHRSTSTLNTTVTTNDGVVKLNVINLSIEYFISP